MKREEPQSIGDIMSAFMKAKDIAMAAAEGSARETWDAVAGPYIAESTRDAFIKNGVLTLSFTRAVIKTEVMMHKREYISAMNRALGSNCIRTIRIL